MNWIACFAWVLVPLTFWICMSVFGTPHVIGTYQYVGHGRGYIPFAERFQTSCTYYGWTGPRTVRALDGRCAWVRFFREAG